MRRLIIWVAIFALAVWVTLRFLRALDQPPVTISSDTAPLPPDALPPSVPSPTPVEPPIQTDTLPHDTSEINAYCARCRERRLLINVHEETTATGRRAARGACSACGTTVFTFLPAKSTTE